MLFSLGLDLDQSIKNSIGTSIKTNHSFKFENESFVIHVDDRFYKRSNNINIENYYKVKIFIRDKPPSLGENFEIKFSILKIYGGYSQKKKLILSSLIVIYNISQKVINNGLSYLNVS